MLDQQHADPGFATVAGDSEWPAALRVGTDGFEGAPLTKHSVPAVKGTARGHALSTASPSCARPIVV